MSQITEEDLKRQRLATLSARLGQEEIHVRAEDGKEFILMDEKQFLELSRKSFELETLLSEREYYRGNKNSGTSKDLFHNLGI